MTAAPTRTITCPKCGTVFEDPVVMFEGREILAARACLCDACTAARSAAGTAESAAARHLALWRSRTPAEYQSAVRARVPADFAPALLWKPGPDSLRLGIWGPPQAGKTMTVSLLLKSLQIPFRWANGAAARTLYNKSVSSDGSQETRRKAAEVWMQYVNAPLLFLDDVDKANFTDAWAPTLYELLEGRNSRLLPTIWTSNLGPGQIALKIGRKCGDQEQADAIERRLMEGAAIFTIATP